MYFMGISRNKAVNVLHNSVLEDKGVLWMGFNPNKTPVEIIKEGAFGGTYFRDISSGVNGKWYVNSWKEVIELKKIDKEYYSSNYFDVKLNKHKVKTETLKFWENEGWINKIGPYWWCQWYFRYFLGRRSLDYFRHISRSKKIVSRFKGKLVKMIKDSGGKFDDYLVSPKIRQILLHWGYELTEKYFFL